MPHVDVPDGPGGPPVQVWNLRPELLPTVQAMIDGPYHPQSAPPPASKTARVRIAELNDCSICRDFHARSVVAAGATDDLYEHVARRACTRRAIPNASALPSSSPSGSRSTTPASTTTSSCACAVPLRRR